MRQLYIAQCKKFCAILFSSSNNNVWNVSKIEHQNIRSQCFLKFREGGPPKGNVRQSGGGTPFLATETSFYEHSLIIKIFKIHSSLFNDYKNSSVKVADENIILYVKIWCVLESIKSLNLPANKILAF